MFEQCSTDGRACVSASDEKIWQPTAVQNLVRYAPSGTYFARFRVGGKLVWKSLKTATFSVAKQRLPDTLRDQSFEDRIIDRVCRRENDGRQCSGRWRENCLPIVNIGEKRNLKRRDFDLHRSMVKWRTHQVSRRQIRRGRAHKDRGFCYSLIMAVAKSRVTSSH